MKRHSWTALLLSATALLAACGMPIYSARLGRIKVRIMDGVTVQAKCAEALGNPLWHPVVAYPMGVMLRGCAVHDESQAVVYSVDSAGVLLHELDHLVNSKWCHAFLGMGGPALCNGEGMLEPDWPE